MRRSSVENSASRFTKPAQSQLDTIAKARALGIEEVSVLFNETFKDGDVDDVLLIIAQLSSESLDISVNEAWFQGILQRPDLKEFLHMLPDEGQLHEKSIQRLRLYKIMALAMAKCRIKALTFTEFCQGLCKETKRHSVPNKLNTSATRGNVGADPKQVLVSRLARWIHFLHELQKIRQQLVETNEGAIEKYVALSNQLQSLLQEQHQLQEYLDSLQQEAGMPGLNQLVKVSENEYRKLRAEEEEKKREHNAAASKYKRAADGLRSQESKLAALDQELSMIKKQADQMREQLVENPEDLRKAHNVATETAEEALQKLTEAESLWGIHVELEKVSSYVASFTTQLRGNIKEFEEAAREYAESQKTLSDLENQARAQQNDLQRRSEGVKSRLAMIGQKLEAARAHENTIKRANADVERREKETEERIQDLHRVLAEEENAIRDAEAESQSRHREFVTLRSQLEETLALYQTTDANLYELRTDLPKQPFKVADEMRTEVDAFKSELMTIATNMLRALEAISD